MAKKTILDFAKMKKTGEKIAYLVTYDWNNAKMAEEAGMDMLLVGDSVGMSIYGYEGTNPVEMDQMIYHAEAVRRGASKTFIIGDMPFLSYQISDEDAVRNAGRFVKKAGCDAIKLEGGKRVVSRIQAIRNSGINVMGHIGLTPQSSAELGGFKVQGKTAESAIKLLVDAHAVERAGAFALLVEAVPPEVTEIIAKRLEIPVLSIGAGPRCDGQLLLDIDLLARGKVFTPKFVKNYFDQAFHVLCSRKENPTMADFPPEGITLAEFSLVAFKEYVREVKEGKFPDEKVHCYKMEPGEFDILKKNRLYPKK